MRTHKLNCWEFQECGKEPGGRMAREFGVCPASTERSLDGVNSGWNGGRACWAVDETLCGERSQGLFRDKVRGCMKCDFYKLVGREEGGDLVFTADILRMLTAARIDAGTTAADGPGT